MKFIFDLFIAIITGLLVTAFSIIQFAISIILAPFLIIFMAFMQLREQREHQNYTD